MLALPLFIDVQTTEQRTQVIEGIDRALAPYESSPAPFLAVRKVGQPYVNTYLDNDTRTSGYKYFPLFMLFVIVLNWLLYRSFRALFAFVLTLGMCAALTVGFIGVTGGTFTIVSSLVPMTILITCDGDAGLPPLAIRRGARRQRRIDEHQATALANKFVAATASIFATAVGFAALAVSEHPADPRAGLWVAAGLVLHLGHRLHALSRRCRRSCGRRPSRSADRRRVVRPSRVAAALRPIAGAGCSCPARSLLCAVGAVALFGIPGS